MEPGSSPKTPDLKAMRFNSTVEVDKGSSASSDDARQLSTDPSSPPLVTSSGGFHWKWRELFRGKKQRNSVDERSSAIQLCTDHERALTFRKLFEHGGEEGTKYTMELANRVAVRPKGPLVEMVGVSIGLQKVVSNTPLGKVRARAHAYTRHSFHGVELEDPKGYALALYSDFDAKSVGNYELILQHSGEPDIHNGLSATYKRAINMYLAGPFHGSGCSLSVGSALKLNAAKESNIVNVGRVGLEPLISADGFVVKPNLATAVLGGMALMGALYLRPKFSTDLIVPLPKTPVSACASVEITEEKKSGRTTINLTRLGNFELRL